MPVPPRGGTVNVAFLGAGYTHGVDGLAVATLLLAFGPVVVALACALSQLLARIPPVPGDARRGSLPDDRCDLVLAVLDWAVPARRAVGAVAPARAPPSPPSIPAAAFRR